MSECGCIYPEFEGDPPTFIRTRTVRARKTHACSECGDPIAAQSSFEHVAAKWDHGFLSFTTCLTCVEIRTLLFCDAWSYGGLWKDIRAHFAMGGNPLGCIKKLETVAAKEKLAASYREYLELEP